MDTVAPVNAFDDAIADGRPSAGKLPYDLLIDGNADGLDACHRAHVAPSQQCAAHVK
jgi:hypothetical protein